MFSVQMASSGVANGFEQHPLQIGLNITTYIILSIMSVFGASVQRPNLVIMSFLTRNTPGRITTYFNRSTMPKPRWPKLITHCAMFTDVSTCLDIFPEL
jgi:hypothetical protein